MRPAAILSVVVKAVGVKVTTAELMDVNRVAGKAAAGTEASAARMAAASGKMKAVGHNLTHHMTLPLAAVGAAAGFMAVDFQESMDKIVGLVGVSKKQVDAWSEDILKMSKAVGKSPKELADAMFFVTSAGLRGKDALDALRESARASASGLGETKVIADAVTSAMNAYGSKAVSAKKATNILTGAVKEGKVEASALAPVLGRVIPVAESMGVSFDQVGASMASMTRLGFSAANSATATRAILMTMAKPATNTTDGLKKMGMSIDDVRKSLKERGMLATLMDLKKHAKASGVEMSSLFPNVRALSGVLALTGRNAGANAGIFKRMADTTGVADKAFKSASDTTRLKMAKSLAGLAAAAITIGNVLLPIFNKVASGVASVVTAFGHLSPGVKQIIVYAAILLAVLGPLLTLLGLLASTAGLVVIAIVAVGVGFLYAYKHSKTFRDVLATIGGALAVAAGAIAAFGAGVVRWIVGAFKDAVHWVRAAVRTVVNEVRQWDTLGSFIGRVFGVIKGEARLLFGALKLIFHVGMALLGPILVTAWTAIKDVFSGAFTAIKGVVSGGFQVLRGVVQIVGGLFKGDFHQVWEGIKTIFHGGLTAIKGILGGAWKILSAPVDAIAQGLHDAFHNTWQRIKSAFKDGINVAISFLNVMIDAINALPFIKDIKKIDPIGGGGGGKSSGGGGGPHGSGKLARGGAFGRTGGLVDRPMVFMGEEAPLHAEYVVPTNPAYKTRAHALIGQAMQATGYAKGGVTDGAARFLGAAKKVWAATAPLLQDSPSHPPSFHLGGGRGREAWAYPDAWRVDFAKTMPKIWAGYPGHGLQTMVHEFAHMDQKAGLSYREREGGAEAFMHRFSPRIAQAAGQTMRGTYPEAGNYQAMEAWVEKNRSKKWIARGQFGLAQGGRWNVQEMADLWRSKGGGASIADTMGVIGLTESGGDPNAENPSGATGLWQILGQLVRGNLRNPGVNALNAIAKYKAQGLHAWDASRSKWGPLIGKTVSLGLDPMSLLPDLGGLPKWLKPMGKGLLKKAKAFISHAVSSVNPFSGGGGGGPSGLGSFDGFQVAKWIVPVLQWARGHGWTGHVTSGYRSHAQNSARGRNYPSNHEGVAFPSGAIDVGGYGAKAEGGALAAVLRGYHGARNLIWGGPVIGDWGHFSATGHKTGGTFGGSPYLGAFKKGGVLPRDGYYKGHAGETVVPAQGLKAGGIVAATASKFNPRPGDRIYHMFAKWAAHSHVDNGHGLRHELLGRGMSPSLWGYALDEWFETRAWRGVWKGSNKWNRWYAARRPYPPRGATEFARGGVLGAVTAFGKGGKHGGKHHPAAHHPAAHKKPPTYDQQIDKQAEPLKAALATAKLTKSPKDDLPVLKKLRALYRRALAHDRGVHDDPGVRKYAGALHSVNNQIDKAEKKPKAAKHPNLPYDQNIQGWLDNLDAALAVAKLTPDTGDDMTILKGEEGLYKRGLRAAKKHGDVAGMKSYAEGLASVQSDISSLNPAPEPDADITKGIAHAQAALAVAKLSPDKGKQLEALKTIQGLDQQGLTAAQARGDDAAISAFAGDLESVNGEIETLTGAIQDQIDAVKEHTAALQAVKDELKSQTDLAKQINSTSAFQQTKFLADIMSGQFGRGIVNRGYGPGTGVEVAY